MQKLSFIKGLVIGAIFSATFWIGAYQLFTNLSHEEEIPAENIIQPIQESNTEMPTAKASI